MSDQALACVAAMEQAARFFRNPSESGAFAAREAGLLARRAAPAGAIPAGVGRRDWLAVSRWLAQAAEEAAAGAVEAGRFSAAGDFSAIATELCAAGRDFSAALKTLADGPRCAQLLVSAKRRAAQAQRLQLRGRAAALDDPNAVQELKACTVLRRLARAAEAWQQAADRVAQLLVSAS